MTSKIKTALDFEAALYCEDELVTLDSGEQVTLTAIENKMIGNRRSMFRNRAVWKEDDSYYACEYLSSDEEGIFWEDYLVTIYQVVPRSVEVIEYVKV